MKNNPTLARLNLLKEIKIMGLEELAEKEAELLLMDFDDIDDRETLLQAIRDRRDEIPKPCDIIPVLSETAIDNDGVESM